jgi:hypothetical protein
MSQSGAFQTLLPLRGPPSILWSRTRASLSTKWRAHGCSWVERKNSAASSGSFAGEEDVAFGLGIGFDDG